jgi:hypothetical protein
MTIDLNSYCPGGTGKKIRHCDCRDICGDLDKIARAMEGNQRAAALDRINRTLATKANRPCLLAMKAAAQLAMGEMQGLEETVATFLQVAPRNLVALAYSAILETAKGHLPAAVDRLQDALALLEKQMPSELYTAIGVVANGLFQTRDYLSARAHLVLQVTFARDDEEALQALISLSGVQSVPSLLKQDFAFEPAPQDASWKRRFEAAGQSAQLGAWKKACEGFQAIDQQNPGQPAVLKNIAVAQTFLGADGAAEAWHAYAALPELDQDEAVRSEALAQLLDERTLSEAFEFVKLVYPVPDANELFEKMSSMKSLVSQPVDASRFAEADAVPPKALFLLLDAEPRPAADDYTIDDVREVLGDLALYGKQTDRDAQLEFTVLKNSQFETALKALSALLGELVDTPADTQILESTHNPDARWLVRAHLPPDLPATLARKLRGEFYQRSFLERWPTQYLPELDGKTPAEAAKDPATHVRLLAAVLCLEQVTETQGRPLEVDRLRERLGLPLPKAIDPHVVDLHDLSVTELHRVDVKKLDDDQLALLFEKSAMFGLRQAFRSLGAEIVQREGLRDKIDVSSVYAKMAEFSTDIDESLSLVLQAQQEAEQAGKSPAQWLIQELTLRLVRHEPEEFARVMERIQRNHLHEPGVADSLRALVAQMGIQPGAAPGGGAPDQPPEPEAASGAGGGIWTPDGDQPAAAEEAKPSKLWLPGSD